MSKKKKSAAELWAHLEGLGARVHYRPVKKTELAQAEKALSLRFPPSYVELVTSVGAPAITAPNIPRIKRDLVANMPFAVLTPKEIVKWTRELRSLDPAMLDDEDLFEAVKEQLDNAVWFQFGANPGEGYVFLRDSVNSKGEMRVGHYAHDYLEELDWSKTGVSYPSFTASTADAAARIEDYLTNYS